MAKRPLRIADALGFGGGRPSLMEPSVYRRAVARPAPSGKIFQGQIKRARPTAAEELAQLLTPDTRFGAELAAKIAPVVEASPLSVLTGLVDARRAYNAGNVGQAAEFGILAGLGAIPGGKGASKGVDILDNGAGLVDILKNGKKVGEIKYQNIDGGVQILRSDVDTPKQGIGSEAYKKFIEQKAGQGLFVASDSVLTDAGSKLWDSLKRSGLNVVQANEARPMYRGGMMSHTREEFLNLPIEDMRYEDGVRTGTRKTSGGRPIYIVNPK